MARATSTLVALLGVVGASCITNASNPRNDQLRRLFRQTESNIVYVAATDTVIVAYNDGQGVYRLDPKNQDAQIEIEPGLVLFPPNDIRYIGQTFAGFSTSANFGTQFGTVWQQGNPIQPIDPNLCLTGSHCPLLMRGDPALATNGQRVLYANIAYTGYTKLSQVFPPMGQEIGPDALAIARDDSGTGNFGKPYTAARLPGAFVDQPSLSMLGDVAVSAFDDGHSHAIYVVTTDASGSDSWYPPQLLFLPTTTAPSLSHAIIKLASPLVAYLAYQEVFFNPPTRTFLNTVVVRLVRTLGSGAWTVDTNARIFYLTGMDMTVTPPAANGSTWADLSPLGFDIGNGGTELHVVTRQPRPRSDNTIVDDVLYFHCVDTNRSTCVSNGPNDNPGWVPEFFDVSLSSGGRFQPWVAAYPGTNASLATVNWYQQLAPKGDRFVPTGVVVGADRPGPHAPIPLSPAYSPCASAVDQNTGLPTYGDYEATGATPYFAPAGSISNPFLSPMWVTAYARSSRCLHFGAAPTDFNSDAFIGSTTWW